MIHLLSTQYGDVDRFDGDTYLHDCILTNKVMQLLPIYKTPCSYNIILSLFKENINIQIQDIQGRLIDTVSLNLTDITLAKAE